jgi:hypothetical protein
LKTLQTIALLAAVGGTGCFTTVTCNVPGGCTTDGGTDGGTTGQPVACAAGAVWVGSTCAFVSCTPQVYGRPCAADGGALGRCAYTTCDTANTQSDPHNCGSLGLSCPMGLACQTGVCALADGGAGSCESPSCPSGQGCDPNLPTPACDWPSCVSSSEGQPCQLATTTGVCCNGHCLDFGGDSANCGGCGAACPGGVACDGGRCLAVSIACPPACPSGDVCALGACVGSLCPTQNGYCATRGGGVSLCCPNGSCPESGSCQ